MVLEGAASALPPSVVKNLGDRLYDKRKLAALEIEQLVKVGASAGATPGDAVCAWGWLGGWVI